MVLRVRGLVEIRLPLRDIDLVDLSVDGHIGNSEYVTTDR